MRQFKTSENFIFKGQSFVGIPLLVDKEDYPVSPVINYMMYLVLERGRINSPQTWQSHADALYDYFSWLEANGLTWNYKPQHTSGGKEPSNLSIYVRWSKNSYRKINGEKLKNGTINTRLACIEAFYIWAMEVAKLIDWQPCLTRMIPSWHGHPSVLAHTHGQKLIESSEQRLPEHKNTPKLLNLDQCRELLAAPMSKTIKLMTILMLVTGLRNEETRTFPRKYVFDPRGLDPRKRIRLDIKPSDMRLKGSKPRTVFIPWQVMATMYEFTCFGEGVERARIYHDREGYEPSVLFLAKDGRPFAPKGLNDAYRKLCRDYEKNGKKQSRKIVFHVTPHMIRHTFATLELYHEAETLDKYGRNKGMGHALTWVRDRLGHSSIQTTTIYVHCLELIESHELNEYQLELGKMIEEGANGKEK